MKKRFLLARILGLLLLILSLGILLAQQHLIFESIRKNTEISGQIQALLPDRRSGIPSDYSLAEMPILQIDSTDYVCLLEVPSLELSVPVENQWQAGLLSTRPGRFWGSIYDGTLILGGGNHKGSFDFCAQLDLGDQILVTDMQGTQFRCSVARIIRSNSADFEDLSDETYPLTLFVRAQYEARYIIVRCDWDY